MDIHILKKIEELGELVKNGILTQEEFEEQKKQLLHPIQSQPEEQNVKKEEGLFGITNLTLSLIISIGIIIAYIYHHPE